MLIIHTIILTGSLIVVLYSLYSLYYSCTRQDHEDVVSLMD